MSRCKGGEPAGEPKHIDFKDGTPDSQADHALAQAERQSRANSRTTATPYRSLVHPMWKKHYGDYDHLARVKEWSLSGGEAMTSERMTARAYIPHRRARACRSTPPIPSVSAFVSANAGSGKTHVLAQRVINLLLRGVDPAKILCITFTKAAAANMANRVFDTLAEWTALDDAALDEEIAQSTGKQADARTARAGAAAVRLGAGDAGRAEGADHPRLLHAAAASVSVRGQCRGALRRCWTKPRPRNCSTRLTLDVLLEASAEPDSALGQALATAIIVAADQTFKEVIGDAIRKRDAIDGLDRSAPAASTQAIAELVARRSASRRTTRLKRSNRNSSPHR